MLVKKLNMWLEDLNCLKYGNVLHVRNKHIEDAKMEKFGFLFARPLKTLLL